MNNATPKNNLNPQTAPVPKRQRKPPTDYHRAAIVAFRYLLRGYVRNGDVSIKNEHILYKQPMRIDTIVVKKRLDVIIDTSWGLIFRPHNIIEYKSPADPPLTLSTFNKVVHGYAGIYASQEDIKLTDMSVTIVCSKKPVRLFAALKNEFNYEVLRKGGGVYYITLKGTPPEKALAIQIIVSPELEDDSDLALRALMTKLDEGVARKAYDRVPRDLWAWWKAVFRENREIFINLFEERRASMSKREREQMEEFLRDMGFLDKSRQEGEQRGVQRVLALLKKGYSPTEVEKMLQPA